MKRYFLFAGDNYYPGTPPSNFIAGYFNFCDASEAAKKLDDDWVLIANFSSLTCWMRGRPHVGLTPDDVKKGVKEGTKADEWTYLNLDDGFFGVGEE